jgi:hypothetical protein
MGRYLALAQQVMTTTEEPQALSPVNPMLPSETPLLAKYPPDELGEPCPDCGSKGKWVWIDGRRLCRRGVIDGDHQ